MTLRDEDGDTALDHARSFGHSEVLTLTLTQAAHNDGEAAHNQAAHNQAPLGSAPGSKRPPAQGAEAVPSLKADRHRRRTKLDRK